jgi:hypothetical protein
MYKVIRFYFNNSRKRTIKTGLTLTEARAHCADPETSSSTCALGVNRRRTRKHGPWFDGYDECRRSVFGPGGARRP